MKGNCSATSNFRASPCGVALHSFRRLAKLARSRGCLRCYCSVRRSQHGAAASTHCANPVGFHFIRLYGKETSPETDDALENPAAAKLLAGILFGQNLSVQLLT